MNRHLPSRDLETAIAHGDATAHAKRGEAFAGARLPYADDEVVPGSNVELAGMTDLGTAAAKVVADVDARRKARPFQIFAWSGEKISAPGVYDIPIDAYHSDCCAGPSISSSGLRTIEARSLAHYWVGSYLNAAREPVAESSAFTLGRAAHHLLLGERGFAERFVLRPAELYGEPWQGNRKACKAWLVEQAALGKTVITEAQIANIRGMADALKRHPLVAGGLMNGEIERSLIWQDDETGVWLKARPDALPLNGEIVVDLKTTSDASPRAIAKSFSDYGYHQQLALVSQGMEKVLGRKPGNDDFVLIFVESAAPWAVSVRPVDPQAIDYGRMLNRRALRKFADALARDDWPAYEADTSTLSLPRWATDNLELQIKSGLLDAA